MADLPEPLTPADCDLRSFPSMLLDVARLRDSDLAAVASGDAFRANVLLWCASWHSLPAASVPDDDIALARLAGYGRDQKGWLQAKADGALRGWTKCSDGRLYHRVVAEKAIAALETKRGQRDRTEAARIERARLRAEREQNQAVERARPSSVTTSVTDSATSATEVVTDLVTVSVTTNAAETVEPELPLSQDPKEGKEGKERSSKPRDASRGPARDASTRIVKLRSPCPNDPRPAWSHLADRLEGPSDPSNEGRPIIDPGGYLDIAAYDVCTAAHFGLDFRGPWDHLIQWMRDGIGLSEIVSVVSRVVKRPNYPPDNKTLKYFDAAIREQSRPP